MPHASEILFTWNEERLAPGTVVEIEDDTLRDGLQASFIRLIVDLIEPEIVAKP